jgi:hypothetical protein
MDHRRRGVRGGAALLQAPLHTRMAPDVAVTPISHTVGHVVGTEAALRLRDPHSFPANLLMPHWAEREGMDSPVPR